MGQHRMQRPPPKRAYQPKRRRVTSTHRANPTRPGARRAGPTHALQPRYGRIVALGAAVSITAVAVASLFGAFHDSADKVPTATAPAAAQVARFSLPQPAVETPIPTAAPAPTLAVPPPAPKPTPQLKQRALPADSGNGRRVVFSINKQRVWLVGSSGRVQDTYLVSGSLTDNLRPGSYQVYSRSRYAVGIDDSGEMQYFVRFTRGERAAIGFHSIPTKDGEPLQSLSELGTPQSHGCIRQKLSDAQTMWDFAPDGTKVVVTA